MTPPIARRGLLLGFLFALNIVNGYSQKRKPVKKETAAIQQSDTIRKAKKFILMGKYFGSSVILRWAPKTGEAWENANAGGYQLYRFEYDRKNKPLLSNPVQLTSNPLRPLTLDQWKQQFKSEDTAAAVAAELLYGKKFETTGRRKEQFSWEDVYTQHADMDNRLGLALFNADIHPDVAAAMAWRWEDKTIERNKTYYYVLIAAATKEKHDDTVTLLVSTQKIYKTPEMLPVLAMPWDRRITLYWNRQLGERLFTGYYIERSDDNGRTFQRANNLPYVSSLDGNRKNAWMQYTDSIPQNYKVYIYRVRGLTAFGETSLPSAPLTSSGYDKKAPGSPLNVKAENTRGTLVKISWKKNETGKGPAGYLVGRSNSANGPFVPLDTILIPPTVYAYVDKYAVPWDKNFYIVASIDTTGIASRSMPVYAIMTDSIPPAAPIGLAGNIDSTGKVNLHWQLNHEPDLEGYNVYASNNPEHAFYPVNSRHIADTSFTDSITLKTLTRHIYYRICAFDKTGNPSAYSKVLQLTKPDIIPPVAPQIDHFIITDSSVSLSWVQSSSEDVAWQALWRKEKKSVAWTRLDSLKKDVSRYVDRKVERLKQYDYSVSAIDSSGNSSERSFPLHARIYDNGKRKEIDELKVAVTTDHSIQLNWKYNQPEREHILFIVYRSYNNNGLELYKNILGDKNEFIDSMLPGEGSYQYAVKVVTDDGGASKLISSQPVSYDRKSRSQ